MGGAYRLGQGAGEGEVLSFEEMADDGDKLATELFAAGQGGLDEDVEVDLLFAGRMEAKLPLPGSGFQRLPLYDTKLPDPGPDGHRKDYTTRSQPYKGGPPALCVGQAARPTDLAFGAGKMPALRRCGGRRILPTAGECYNVIPSRIKDARGDNIDELTLRALLESVADGRTDIHGALDRLRHLPYEDLGFAKVDHHRALRGSLPEVVLGQGKTPEQVVAIAERLVERSGRLLVTRIDSDVFRQLHERVPDAVYHEVARAATVDRRPGEALSGVCLVCAGTADLPVAEEAAVTAELMGNRVDRVHDVGVAGLHRLLDHLPQLGEARVLIVVAGMEGALPSVVSGLVAAPVIAVPTSIGYGASFQGVAPLLTMLNSCAPGVAVVNIDNGFGAGYLAAVINRLAHMGIQSASS
jgi:NCAIR mutase (PurE)-related protein